MHVRVRVGLGRIPVVEANGPDGRIVADTDSEAVAVVVEGRLLRRGAQPEVAPVDVGRRRPDVPGVEKERAPEVPFPEQRKREPNLDVGKHHEVSAVHAQHPSIVNITRSEAGFAVSAHGISAAEEESVLDRNFRRVSVGVGVPHPGAPGQDRTLADGVVTLVVDGRGVEIVVAAEHAARHVGRDVAVLAAARIQDEVARVPAQGAPQICEVEFTSGSAYSRRRMFSTENVAMALVNSLNSCITPTAVPSVFTSMSGTVASFSRYALTPNPILMPNSRRWL